MNIHEFFQAAVDGLQKYIFTHYDKDFWYENWVGLSDIGKYFRTCGGLLGNSYFMFDWGGAAYRRMAQQYTLYRCTHCGATTDESNTHAWCKASTRALTEDEACGYFMRYGYTIPEEILADALEIDGWKAFCTGTHKFTDPVKDEILECLTAIARDEGAEQLVHLTWALNIMHRNGNVTLHYSTIDGPLLNAVQQYGLRDMFGEEDVNKFLAGEYPKIKIDLEKLNSLQKEAQ